MLLCASLTTFCEFSSFSCIALPGNVTVRKGAITPINEGYAIGTNAHRISKYPLCVELFRLANESLEKTGGEPMLLRRSKLHANILDNITIFIEPEDLLCGSGASKPFGLEMQYEYGVWTKDEVGR